MGKVLMGLISEEVQIQPKTQELPCEPSRVSWPTMVLWLSAAEGFLLSPPVLGEWPGSAGCTALDSAAAENTEGCPSKTCVHEFLHPERQPRPSPRPPKPWRRDTGRRPTAQSGICMECAGYSQRERKGKRQRNQEGDMEKEWQRQNGRQRHRAMGASWSALERKEHGNKQVAKSTSTV